MTLQVVAAGRFHRGEWTDRDTQQKQGLGSSRLVYCSRDSGTANLSYFHVRFGSYSMMFSLSHVVSPCLITLVSVSSPVSAPSFTTLFSL